MYAENLTVEEVLVLLNAKGVAIPPNSSEGVLRHLLMVADNGVATSPVATPPVATQPTIAPTHQVAPATTVAPDRETWSKVMDYYIRENNIPVAYTLKQQSNTGKVRFLISKMSFLPDDKINTAVKSTWIRDDTKKGYYVVQTKGQLVLADSTVKALGKVVA
jgi:hypothetical protein